ncbi:hypothetical protein EJ06DRAFT_226648 [Trichodelitschia bisporula]|uniref:Apple domain-containing protein n=1 Tax=Trichodelitschia bisporula TaxID=703511 RepID=A0A6G1HL70_9PEZI|nr:hypothetical protein EJ06DRAFT_226648 [Trichodelitschia bisporula]
MYFQHSILLATLLTLAPALPLTHTTRAGAPLPKPITNCTTAALLLPAPFRPTAVTLSTLLYAYYLPPSDPRVVNGTSDSLFDACLQTCAGYGLPGDCASVFQAGDVPAPPRFGSPGGWASVACELYGTQLAEADLEDLPEGEGWTEARAAELEC